MTINRSLRGGCPPPPVAAKRPLVSHRRCSLNAVSQPGAAARQYIVVECLHGRVCGNSSLALSSYLDFFFSLSWWNFRLMRLCGPMVGSMMKFQITCAKKREQRKTNNREHRSELTMQWYSSSRSVWASASVLGNEGGGGTQQNKNAPWSRTRASATCRRTPARAP